jgi:hypothetical protein
MNTNVLEYQIIELERELTTLYAQREGIVIKERNPTEFARWYTIDNGQHYIVCQGLRFQSDLFWIESRNGDTFYGYYKTHFGIEYDSESELLKRLRCLGGNDYVVIDPDVKGIIVKKTEIPKYKYCNYHYRMLSNNKSLFDEVIKMLAIKVAYLPRDSLKWFNTEIKQYLTFVPPIIDSKKIIKTKIDGYDVYYSEQHKIWGFNEKEFNHIYTLEVGHSPEQQEILLNRLRKRPYGMYINLDPSISKMDGVCKDYIKRFKFIDHKLMIVANSKTVFNAYRKLLSD